jgi:cathepsin F
MRSIVLFLLFACLAVQANTPSKCSTTDYLGITDISFNPTTIKSGSSLTTTVTGKPTKTINSGTLKTQILYSGINVKTTTYNLCTQLGITCPLESGVAIKASITETVSSTITFTGTLQIITYDESNIQISCVSTPITVNKALPSSESLLVMEEFKNFKLKYNKQYESEEEEAIRFENFQNSLKRVTFKNTYGDNVFGITKFSDLSPEEFRAGYLNYKPRGPMLNVKTVTPTGSAPSSFDWRDRGAVTAVKDQGYCGSCWAFSTVEAIESAWEIAGNPLTVFSEQQIVACDTNDAGCNGGNPPTAYEYVQSAGGLALETDYPYASSSGTSPICQNFTVSGGQISAYSYATEPCYARCARQNEDTLASTVATIQPPSICVDASEWSDYTGGVLTTSSCSSKYLKLDHCVQLVGYNGYTGSVSESTNGYWIVRNSWNTDWGVDGYIYLQMGTNTCGIADEATVVSIA